MPDVLGANHGGQLRSAPGPLLGTAMRNVDLSCDIGEGHGMWRFGTDEQLLAVVTSVNIACGVHAGDPSTMRRMTQLAVENGVAIGALVGYPDLQDFRRRSLGIDRQTLADEVLAQLGALDAFARSAGGRIAYVKPHADLCYAETAHAWAVLDAMTTFDSALPLLVPPGSVLQEEARRYAVDVRLQGCADRRYSSDGRVAPDDAVAVVDNPRDVARQALQICCDREVDDRCGNQIRLDVESICIHDNTPRSVEVATAVVAALIEMSIECRSVV